MAIDINSKYFVVKIDDCATSLSMEDLDKLQGLIKRVDFLTNNDEQYHVYVLNKDKVSRQSVGKNARPKK